MSSPRTSLAGRREGCGWYSVLVAEFFSEDPLCSRLRARQRILRSRVRFRPSIFSYLLLLKKSHPNGKRIRGGGAFAAHFIGRAEGGVGMVFGARCGVSSRISVVEWVAG